ncbi:MAG TPA: hypothetical protein DCO73_13640 [Alphaproteobacteria bacterium]|jgi:hypothetical protein|nr:hypothetical protein [Alphaproteobacteria bacterium]
MRSVMRTGTKICGAVAVIFIAAMVVTLLADWQAGPQGAAYHATTAGELWHKAHAPSLNLTQAITERYISPALWSAVMLPILLAPVWVVALGKAGFFALLAVILHLSGRRRDPTQAKTD